jgi:2-oxoisovalerate ferredoxin oxidoreductase beta subunit
MEKTFPLGVFSRSHQGRAAAPAPAGRRRSKRFRGFWAWPMRRLPEGNPLRLSRSRRIDLHVRVAGFGGQGVLLLGEVLAEAGLDAGLRSLVAAFLRAGDALGHVELPCALSSQPIDSPLVSRPNVLVAMNEPSLRKFDASVRPADG